MTLYEKMSEMFIPPGMEEKKRRPIEDMVKDIEDGFGANWRVEQLRMLLGLSVVGDRIACYPRGKPLKKTYRHLLGSKISLASA